MTSMTSPMDEVVYDSHDFVCDPRQHVPPPHFLPDRHILYHLQPGTGGYLPQAIRDAHGHPQCSPRRLRDICIYKLASDFSTLQKIKVDVLPSNVYPLLLTEGIALREPHTIEWTVSTWPMKTLRVYENLPMEDILDNDYLTQPLDGHEKTSLADCFVLGLLKLKPEANLKYLDFTGFSKDRKLSKELCRLPLLWMKPSERTLETMHQYMSSTVDVSKDKVERFLNRIRVVYSNVDGDFHHGNKIEPVTLSLDLKIILDDVPLGLSLQPYSPFKFGCRKLWMKPIEDVGMKPSNLGLVLNVKNLTHFELADKSLSSDNRKMEDLLDTLPSFTNLYALSLPQCIDLSLNQTPANDLNQVLRKLRHLRKLSFSYCSLQGHLEKLLDGLHQKLVYLNLKDCQLTAEDVLFLAQWRPLGQLKELNLSCNKLASQESVVRTMMERMTHLTCLSISYCSFSAPDIELLSHQAKECSCLKVLCMQGYTPFPLDITLPILETCAQIKSLQKLLLFPETYAFPGNNETEREANKNQAIGWAYHFLGSADRQDIELE